MSLLLFALLPQNKKYSSFGSLIHCVDTGEVQVLMLSKGNLPLKQGDSWAPGRWYEEKYLVVHCTSVSCIPLPPPPRATSLSFQVFSARWKCIALYLEIFSSWTISREEWLRIPWSKNKLAVTIWKLYRCKGMVGFHGKMSEGCNIYFEFHKGIAHWNWWLVGLEKCKEHSLPLAP